MTTNDFAVRTVDDLREFLIDLYERMPYADYLRTAHWQQTRGSALRRSDYHCQLCRSQERLEVHHNTYDNLGREYPEDLIVLCHDCHAKFHDKNQDSQLIEYADIILR